MSSLIKIEVDEDEDIKSGFTIRFEFAKNEHFTNGHGVYSLSLYKKSSEKVISLP